MLRFPLLRRQQVWFPTLWGWCALLVIAVAACVIAGRYIHIFLAQNDPVPQARILVVEGWLTGEELDQAVVAFRMGGYARVITTGGPTESWLNFNGHSNYADWAASYLKTHGLADNDVTPVPAPASAQERTFLSAVKVRDWAVTQRLALNAFNVFSAGTHARRSRIVYRMAFGPNVEVGILSAQQQEYDEHAWWRTSAGAKSVITETISLLWTICCFYPAPPHSEEEMWGEQRHAVRQ